MGEMTIEQRRAVAMASARARMAQSQETPEEAPRMDLPGMVTRGLTAGVSDYVGAAGRYVGDKIGGAITGQPSMSYNDALISMRNDADAYRDQNPVKGYGGEIAGGIVSPLLRGAGMAVDAGMNAATRASPAIAQSVAQGAGKYLGYGLQGAVGGGLVGAGTARGEDNGIPTMGDVARTASADAAGGAVLGFGVPAVGAVAGRVATKAAPMLQAGLDRLPGNQTSAAAREFAKAVRADKLTPAELAAQREALGPEAVLADVGGKNTQRLAGTMVRSPGETPELADQVLSARQAKQGSRLVDSTKRNVSDTDFYESLDELDASQRKFAGPLYERVFDPAQADYYGNAVNSVKTERLLKNPEVRTGLSKGLRILRNEADADGVEGHFTDTLFEGDNLNDLDLVMKKVPTLRLLDAAKRGLDAKLRTYRNLLTGKLDLDEEGRSIEKLRKSLVDELDTLTTDKKTGLSLYKEARQAYAGPAQIEDAMWMGRRFARGDEEVAIRTFQKLPPSLQDAYRDGVAREIIGQIRKKGGTPAILKNVLGDTDVQARLKAVSKDRASFDNMLSDIQREATFSKTTQEAFGGSQTAQRFASENDLGMDMSGAVVDLAMGRPGAAAGGLLGSVVRALKNPQLPKETRDQLGKWLYSQKPEDQAAAIAALNSKAKIFGAIPRGRGVSPQWKLGSTGAPGVGSLTFSSGRSNQVP